MAGKQIKARFYVAEFTKRPAGEGFVAQVVLRAVRRKTDDNVEWAKYTPAGTLNMSVDDVPGGAYATLEALLGKDVSLTLKEITEE